MSGSLCRRSQCFRLRLQESGSEKGALEAHFLPSSRLANEAVGTTIRFIQASAPEKPRRESKKQKQLKKRVVPKTDGRYLIYYEKP